MFLQMVEKRTSTFRLENENKKKAKFKVFFDQSSNSEFFLLIHKPKWMREQTNPKNQAKKLTVMKGRPLKSLKKKHPTHHFSSFKTVYCFLLGFDWSNYVFCLLMGAYGLFECINNSKRWGIWRIYKDFEKKGNLVQAKWAPRLKQTWGFILFRHPCSNVYQAFGITNNHQKPIYFSPHGRKKDNNSPSRKQEQANFKVFFFTKFQIRSFSSNFTNHNTYGKKPILKTRPRSSLS